jgi:hypothetical protein
LPRGLGAYAEHYDAGIAQQIRGVHYTLIDHHGIKQSRVNSAL